jgi:Asp-tRNA(Asn)/Glu-tRNA(Gln) amidotransferase A subunit family amidase
MTGFDANDSYTVARLIAGPPEGGSYASGFANATASKLRIGVVNELFGSGTDPDTAMVSACIRYALSKLEEAGARFVNVEIPNLSASVAETSLYQTRSRSDMNGFFGKQTNPTLKELTIESIYKEKAFHPSLDLFRLIAEGPASPHEDREYSKKLQAQEEFRRVVLSSMASNEVDMLAFPDCKIAAPLTKDMLDGRWGIYDFPTNTFLASQAILPAVSVPVGLTEGSGLPVGLELVGFLYKEQGLLEAAYVVEQIVQGRTPPPRLI